MIPQDFASRLERIKAQIAVAAARAGRSPEEITLVAVTKTHPPELIEAAHAAGLRDFGENRVAELLAKQARLQLPDARWHFVGHIQRRKAKELVGHSHLIHSVDRLSLAEELSSRARATGSEFHGLIQVNSSGEESKGGWPVFSPEGQEQLLREVEQLLALPALKLHGLMTMAPFYEEPERTRPAFARVREMQQRLVDRFPDHDFQLLSMGMTNDFQVAIEEGATHVRIGTALFGPRER